MECWYQNKVCVEFISDGMFRLSKMKILAVQFLKRSNFEAYFRLRTNLRVCYVYVEELFDNISNMGYGREAYNRKIG